MKRLRDGEVGRRLSGLFVVLRDHAELLYSRFLDLPRNVRESVLLALDLVSIPLAFGCGLVLRVGLAPEFAPGPREATSSTKRMGRAGNDEDTRREWDKH